MTNVTTLTILTYWAKKLNLSLVPIGETDMLNKEINSQRESITRLHQEAAKIDRQHREWTIEKTLLLRKSKEEAMVISEYEAEVRALRIENLSLSDSVSRLTTTVWILSLVSFAMGVAFGVAW